MKCPRCFPRVKVLECDLPGPIHQELPLLGSERARNLNCGSCPTKGSYELAGVASKGLVQVCEVTILGGSVHPVWATQLILSVRISRIRRTRKCKREE